MMHFTSRRTARRPARRLRPARKLLLETLEPRQLLAGDPIISEFVASNRESLLDGDGNSPDWIEIHNRGDMPIDMAGWHLTDDAAELTQWTFPSVTVEVDDYLVVFASGTGVPDIGGNLHASFALGASGEYLALVMPDGTTIASEFSPEYPKQIEDVSYGVEIEATSTTTLIAAGAGSRVLIPGGTIVDWTETSFDDSGWIGGVTPVPTGIGFEHLEEGGLPENLVAHFAFDEAQPSSSVHETVGATDVPITGTGSFVAGQVGGAIDLDGASHIPLDSPPEGLRDGFTIATWLNPNSSIGSIIGWHDTSVTKGLWLGYSGGGPQLTLAAGASAAPGSTGTLRTVTAPGTMGNQNQWYHLTVTFDPTDTSEEVKFYLDGVRLTTGVNGANLPDGQLGDAATQTFRVGLHDSGAFAWDGKLDDLAVFDRPLGDAEIATIAQVGVLGGDAAVYDDLIATDVLASMHEVNSTAYVRIPFSVDNPAAFNSLSLRMKYDDGFVAYLNGMQVASANAPVSPAWNSSATGEHATQDARQFETFNLTAHLPLLQAGANNVLAIHGLNLAADDSDFLVLGELLGSSVGESLRYFAKPTPGEANNTGVLGIVADTTFSVDRGFYDTPIDIAITSATPDAEIRFTTDGSEPTATHGEVYDGPIHIEDETTTLRAAAFREDYLPTNVDTHTYIYLEDVIRQPNNPDGFPTNWNNYNIGPTGSLVPADYAMNQTIVNSHSDTIIDDLKSLPTLSIVMDREDLFGLGDGVYPNPFNTGPSREKTTSLEWIDPNAGPEFQLDAGIRLVGGWSRHFWATPKKSFTLRFRREHGGPPKLDFPLFADNQADSAVEPTDVFETVMLRAVFSDAWPDAASAPQYLRDLNARFTQLAMGQPSSHGTWVHLYLDGLYWGIYNVSERPDADFGASYYGGEPSDFDVVKHTGLCGPGCASTNSFEVVDGDGATFVAALNLARGGLADAGNYEQFKQLVDVENLADYILLEHYIGNTDWPHKNWYASRKREAGEGWKFYVWDSEYTLNGANDRLGVGNSNTPAELYAAARQNAEFRVMFGDRVQKHMFNDGALQPAANIARYEALADQIDAAIKAEAARWGDNGATRKGATNYTHAGWESVRNGILSGFFPGRHNSALSQLRNAGLYPTVDAPAFSQHGGRVIQGFDLGMSAPGGTIFYTLDGTDPRIGDGTVSSTILLPEGAPATAWVPTGSISTSWREDLAFNDLDWQTGTTGIGYDDNPDYQALIGLDIDAQINPDGVGDNEYNSVYIRTEFNVIDPAAFDFMTLKMKYDDGFVAYLNGTRIAGTNDPNPLAWDSEATTDHPDSGATVFSSFDVSSHLGLLQPGTNLLAIHGLNRLVTSSDMLITPQLEAGETTMSGTSPSAIEYVDGAVLSDSSVVSARVLSGASWSALNQATFIVDVPSPLRITEIMYHPTGSGDAEFIELHNTGDESINLAGVEFIDGVEFTFGDVDLEADEYIVVVRDETEFNLTYGGGIAVAGEFVDSRLSNNGERLTLVDAFGLTITDVDYDDEWYPITDGLGFSLAVVDADAESLSEKSAWNPSGQLGGSPGAAAVPTDRPPPGSIVVSEVVTLADQPGGDWIELHNTTLDLIDLEDWFLSDDPTNPTKVQLPEGTSIPAGGYLVLTQAADYGPAVAALGFDLSELGGAISLASGSPAGELTGYQEVQSLGAVDADVSLGQYETSQGRFDFVALESPTFELPNDVPTVGPVVFNEIMYHPADGGDEFIELHNITAQPVALHEPGNPNNPWVVDGGVDFDFPAGVVIPAGGYLVLTENDPETFRAARELAGDVLIFGPFSNNLENAGESISLLRPSTVGPGGLPASILVDRVRYDDTAPWPIQADGDGPSLERVDSAQYGDDPINWMFSAFGGSPGSVNIGIDTTPPGSPAGVSVIVSGASQADVSWTAATDAQSGIGAYNIFRDDVLIGTVAGVQTTFLDDALPATGAAYRVSAVNGDLVEGTRSAVALVTMLQDGNSPSGSYTGTDDTQLSENTPTIKFGAATTLVADHDDPEGTENASLVLWRWDVSDIPSTALIDSASITLDVISPTSLVYEVYEMRQDWDEDQADWNQYADGPSSQWQVAGAAGSEDRGATVLGTLGPAAGAGVTLVLNAAGTALVQSWVDGSVANNGLMLIPTGSGASEGGGAVLDDLIAFYDFEEISAGQAIDLSGNGNHGTVANVAESPTGFNGGAFSFNGSAHVVAPIDINPSARPRLTMGAWVRSSGVNAGLYKILGHDNGGWDRTVGLDTRGNGGFRWTAFIGNGNPIANTPAPVFDQWTFIAATYDNTASTVTLYVDLDAESTGDALQSFTNPTGFNPGQTTVAIGNLRPDNFSEAFVGLMDNVFFFNEELTGEQIEQIRNGGEGYFLDAAVSFSSAESAIAADRPRLSVSYTTGLRGDTDDDGDIDAEDIDTLYDNLNPTNSDPRFDLDGDSDADQQDVDVLVHEILMTNYGDVNLDGSVTRVDVAAIIRNLGRNGSGTWATGDSTGDDVVGLDDFAMARATLGSVGPPASPSAIATGPVSSELAPIAGDRASAVDHSLARPDSARRRDTVRIARPPTRSDALAESRAVGRRRLHGGLSLEELVDRHRTARRRGHRLAEDAKRHHDEAIVQMIDEIR